MARRNKTLWYVPVDQSGAGETTIQAAATGQKHAVIGFLLVPDGDGTFTFNSDTTPGGAGTETSHTGVCKMKDGNGVGFRGEERNPIFVSNAGEALVLETATSTMSGFVYGYTEGA